MACIPAPSCKAALAEASNRWPGRSKASDGICGDASHQARPSDHNSGNAWDLTRDLDRGVDTRTIADWLRLEVLAGRETRVKYLISESRIFNPSISPDWRPYGGSNPHVKHMHCSIHASARNDTSPWFAGFLGHQEEDLTPTQAAELANVNQNVQEIENGLNALQVKVDQLLNAGSPASLSSADVQRIAKAVLDQMQVRLQS